MLDQLDRFLDSLRPDEPGPAPVGGGGLAFVLTGGGALLGGLDDRLAHETGMPIRVAAEPLYSVVVGSGRALENIDAMRGLMSLGGEN